MKKVLNKLKNFTKLQTRIFIICGALVVAIILVVVLFSNSSEIKLAYQLEQPDLYSGLLIIKTFKNTFSIQPVNARENVQKIIDKKDKNKVRYIDAYQNTDVVQTRQTDKLKEDIILKQPGHPEKFEYQLDLENYEFEKTGDGDFIFYEQGHLGEELYKIFIIPAPYLIESDPNDPNEADVGFVEMIVEGDRLILIPDKEWLDSHEYPIILDPTIEITILNIHSHPQQGDDWVVEFTTQGQNDLYIIPDDQATIDDDEFRGLYCNGEIRTPQILADDVIFYPDWECLPRQSGMGAGDGIAKVVHYTLVAGKHTLRFEFGEEVEYAYNTTPNFSGNYKWAWGENIGWNNFEPTNGGVEVADNGLTGYVWAENVGWIKFDYDGTPGAVNTSATNWGVTNDGGNLGGYAWGENIGWVNFNPNNSQVIIDGNGDFSGYAWGENVGWIKFDHSQTSYTPKTTWSPVSAPTVTTDTVKNIQATTATAYGNITATGGADVTTRGFKYGLTEADTWSASETGTYSTGSYNLGLTSLTKGTTYYLRSFATNSEGTAYGAYIPFVTGVEADPIIFLKHGIFKKNVIFK